MKCSEIFEYLTNLYPLELAMDWDNSGFLIGRSDKEVKNVLVVLDITNEVLEYARAKDIDLIVSHHPIIFSALKRVTDETLLGNYILKILKNDICVISMHTNFDIAKGGMADICSERLGLSNTCVFERINVCDEEELGIGKIGDLKKDMSLDELIKLVKTKFDLSHVSVFGRENINSNIRRVAISPGSGKGMYKYAVKRADVLITGDITHHDGLDAANDGVCIIDATHYGLEHLFIEKVKSDLIKLDKINVFEYKNTNPIEIV
nr:Nif3-like dinuclear metal center hexameric protein [uncultured Lachnoanaerobaculum sp.]